MKSPSFDNFKRKRKIIFFLSAIFIVVSVLFAVLISIPKLKRYLYIRDFPLTDLIERNKNQNIVLNGATYIAKIDSGVFTFGKDNNNFFQSDYKWIAYDFLYGDFDNDDQDELGVLYWMRQDYGREVDIAKERRGDSWSCHLFLYSIEENDLDLKWGSSTLNDPIIKMEIINQDVENVLKVDEGRYSDFDEKGSLETVEVTYWEWEGWWFGRIDDL